MNGNRRQKEVNDGRLISLKDFLQKQLCSFTILNTHTYCITTHIILFIFFKKQQQRQQKKTSKG